VDDGVFCNGIEVCNGIGLCTSIDPPCVGNSLCNNTCNEESHLCFTSYGTLCEDDNVFCNGIEVCNGTGYCISIDPPCVNNSSCNNTCNEDEENCFTSYGTSCTDDNIFCDGIEVCNGVGLCTSIDPPCVGNSLCNNTCNEESHLCFTSYGTSCKDDNIFCNGIEVCNGTGYCISIDPPCVNNSSCNNTCNEDEENCFTSYGTSCVDDNIFCNGIEVCNGVGLCTSVDPPCVGNSLCNNTCNEERHFCFTSYGTSCKDDNIFCNGIEVCNGTGYCISIDPPCVNNSFCNNTCNEDKENCFTPNGTLCENDYIFCDGIEVCNGVGLCISIDPPCVNKSYCNTTCNEEGEFCVGTLCVNDGIYCNGVEVCNSAGDCISVDPPCVGNSMCNNTCNEEKDNCLTPNGTLCEDDNIFCDGIEVCNGVGYCTSINPPCVNNSSCNNTCNEDEDNCFTPNGTLCEDDGIFCDGIEVCTGTGYCASVDPPCVENSFCNNTCNEEARNCVTPSGTTDCIVSQDGYCSFCQDGYCQIIEGSSCNIANTTTSSSTPVADLTSSLKDSSNTIVPLTVGLSVGLAVILVVSAALLTFLYRKKRHAIREKTISYIELPQVHSIKKVVILQKLGGGQFGDVYHGMMNVSVNVFMF
jgi:hypothetical protein